MLDRFTWLVVAACVVFAAKPALSQMSQTAEQKVDALAKEVLEGLHIPGMSIAVVREGKPILVKAYGYANLEHDVPAKPETVYLLASITKSFTATAIMKLVEEGKVGLEEPISKYLPDTPDAWKPITVRHLLTHTGGLKDRFEGRTAQEWLLNFTTEEMYKASRSQPLDFQPGEKFQYSDQGYFLLGLIIEKVTGKSYRQFLTERIFKPLSMTATTTINLGEIVKNIASGYTLVNGKTYHNHRRTDYGLVSHFGILSTVQDMAKFDAALYSETLLKKATLAQMWTPVRLKDGGHPALGPWTYGFGWFLSDLFGHRIVQHGGSTGTAFWRMPDDKLTVIVLTNLEQLAGGDATSIAKDIARIYVPGLSWSAQKPQPDPDPKRTQALKEEIERASAGKPDASQYAQGYGAAVLAGFKQAQSFYQSIGPMSSFTYLGSKPNGKGKTLYYKAQHKAVALYYTINLDGEGKIASLLGEPGE